MRIKIKLIEIRAVAIFASRDESRYVLNGVQVQTGKQTTLTATDGRCLGSLQIESSTESDKSEFIIPSAAVAEIVSVCKQKKADGFEIQNRGNRLLVRIGGHEVFAEKIHGKIQKTMRPNNTRAVLIFKAISGNYPNWRQVAALKFGSVKHLCLSAFVAQKVIAASRIISPKEPGMNFFFVDELSAVVVKFAAVKNFIVVAMPMRLGDIQSAEIIPSFAKL